MIRRPAFAEEIGNAFIAGNVGRNCDHTNFFRSRLQALGIAGGDRNISAFALRQLGGRKAYTR